MRYNHPHNYLYNAQAGALRAALAERLGGRSVPFLELSRDRLSTNMQRTINLLNTIEREQASSAAADDGIHSDGARSGRRRMGSAPVSVQPEPDTAAAESTSSSGGHQPQGQRGVALDPLERAAAAIQQRIRVKPWLRDS